MRSPELTGGAGLTYEDAVAAYCLVCAVRGSARGNALPQMMRKTTPDSRMAAIVAHSSLFPRRSMAEPATTGPRKLANEPVIV